MDQLRFGKVLEAEIIIAPDFIVKVNDMILFPHGYDGFHLWEAGIVLTRYLHYNQKQTFDHHNVLELGTGVGLTGIYLAKFTQASQVLITDYKDTVIQNAKKNALKNMKVNDKRCKFLNLDWTKNDQYDYQFQFIVGADLIYTGAPLNELYQTIKRFLLPKGILFLLVPTQRQAANEFFKIVELDKCFLIEEELLEQPEIYSYALKDIEQSKKVYQGLMELKFFIYKLTKV